MNMPGFNAEASLEKSSKQYRSSGTRTAPLGVVPSIFRGTCPPGSELSGCPRGTFCGEPGGPPFPCQCLRCYPLYGSPGTD